MVFFIEYPLLSSDMASWKITERNEVSGWEIHRTKLIFYCYVWLPEGIYIYSMDLQETLAHHHPIFNLQSYMLGSKHGIWFTVIHPIWVIH